MTPRAGADYADRRGRISWMMFDWATQPFFTLVLTFLFAPYFAATFVGDATRGQEIWGYAIAAMGLIVAFASPVAGAIADAAGKRKPGIAIASVIFVPALCLLWLAEPGKATALFPVVAAIIAAGVAVEIATVFTNAMMPGLVPPAQLGRLSGYGWAVGYAGGLLSLVLAAGFLVADGETGKTMLGLKPVLPLDALAGEGERLIGPLCAFWYALFVLPLFLFTPDKTLSSGAKTFGAAVREGLAQLARSIRHVRQYANIVRFLVARMLYADGLAAIFTFGGIYAASIFGWSAVELGIFGIILTIAASIGAVIGGPLDDRLGARAVILVALIILIIMSAGALSVTRDTVLFGMSVGSTAAEPGIFASTGERVYLAFSVGIGLVAGPVQAASRSLLARLAPEDMVTEFFGLFAFSGKVTAFAAPLTVGLVTGVTGDQRLGIAAIAIFLVGGLVVLLGVREDA